MYKWALNGYILLLVHVVTSENNDSFKIEIPNIHSTQEIYKGFENEYKIENIPELEGSILTTSSTSPQKSQRLSGECQQDLSKNCPEGWEDNNETCKAPESYKGDCKRIISFNSMTIEEKANWANSCNVRWPCKSLDKCTNRNVCYTIPHPPADVKLYICNDSAANDMLNNFYQQPCPELFIKQKTDNGTYICIPDYSVYDGPCQTFVDFTNFTDESKQQWADSCKTNWPCMTKCVNVFSDCPMDWTMDDDGLCTAPSNYNGPCDSKKSFKYFTPKMKLDYVKSCNLPFECIESCIKDYTKCPSGWYTDGSYCLPPEGIDLCILDLKKFLQDFKMINQLSKDDKVLLESKCELTNWPCLVNDNIDWSKPCPEGRVLDSDGKCSGEVGVEDECKMARSFSNEEEKRYWSSQCGISWPRIKGVDEKVTIPGMPQEESKESLDENKVIPINGPIHSGVVYNVKNRAGNKEGLKPMELNYQSQLKRVKRRYIDL